MTFDLVRFNWPNTAAILALAAMPAIALATLAPSHTPATEAFVMADATNCQLPAEMRSHWPPSPPHRWNSKRRPR